MSLWPQQDVEISPWSWGFTEDCRAPHSEASGFPGGSFCSECMDRNPWKARAFSCQACRTPEEPMTSALGGYVYSVLSKTEESLRVEQDMSWKGSWDGRELHRRWWGRGPGLIVAEENNQEHPLAGHSNSSLDFSSCSLCLCLPCLVKCSTAPGSSPVLTVGVAGSFRLPLWLLVWGTVLSLCHAS